MRLYLFKIFVYCFEEVIWWVLMSRARETIWREKLHWIEVGVISDQWYITNSSSNPPKFYAYLICRMSWTKVNCSTWRQKAKIVEECKDFTTGLVNRCYDGPSMLSIKACNSAHDIVWSSTIKPACWLIKEEKLGVCEDLLFCPPLMPLTPHPPILVFMESCRPISLMVMSALSFFSDFDMESGNWSRAE